jgi:transcriptional regulator NrdR family protein
MESIIISFYYNHYFILEIKNKYSDRYLKSLVNSVKSLYDNNDDNKKYKELKKEYIIKINELIIILKYTLDNTISNGNTDKISDYIKKSSVNKYIVDELIKFDENNDNKKIILNENIDNIKDFVENTENIKNFLENKDAYRDDFDYDDLITNEYVNNIKGIYNKIEFFVSYIEKKQIKSSKYNEKNIEFINNMLMEQKNLLEIISNADVNKLNFNSVLKEFKYLEKFDNIISDYNNYYREYYNIELKNLIKEQNEQDEKSTYTNSSDKEKSNIVYKNANVASNMVLLLLTIYIIILYLLIKI